MSRLAGKHCCEEMRRQLTLRCEDHEDLGDCPDLLSIRKNRDSMGFAFMTEDPHR
jgi:hypothetical protein